ncbi:MAG: hypothetical protein ACFCVH_01145 [Alphaproteobacteria bacterium]
MAVLTFGTGAMAADRAGAAALQADFDGFLADLEQAMPLRIEPESPVQVTVKGDAYQVDIAPLVVHIEGPDGTVAELLLSRTSMRLVPDRGDPDLTAFEVLVMPAIGIEIGGRAVVHLSYGSMSASGRWSDALDQMMDFRSRATDVSIAIDLGSAALLPVGQPSSFVTTIALLESEQALTAQPRDLWAVRNSVRLEGMSGTFVRDAGPIEFQRYDSLAMDATMSGVPLEAWRDYVVHWLPALLSAAVAGEGLDRDDLVAMVIEMPTLFDGLVMTTTSEGVLSQGVEFDRQEQRVEIQGASLDVLDFSSLDTGSGIRFLPAEDDAFPELSALAAALMPESYSVGLEMHRIPFGHAWRALLDTVDVWIDDPQAAADIFFRSFASRAQTLASDGTLDVELDWPGAQLAVLSSVVADPDAALGITATIDGAFTDMEAIADLLIAADQAETAAGFAVLQAFGQREETGDAVVIRYRLDVPADGMITFNGQDLGPVTNMVDDMVRGLGFRDFGEDWIPDQD